MFSSIDTYGSNPVDLCCIETTASRLINECGFDLNGETTRESHFSTSQLSCGARLTIAVGSGVKRGLEWPQEFGFFTELCNGAFAVFWHRFRLAEALTLDDDTIGTWRSRSSVAAPRTRLLGKESRRSPRFGCTRPQFHCERDARRDRVKAECLRRCPEVLVPGGVVENDFVHLMPQGLTPACLLILFVQIRLRDQLRHPV